MSSSTGEAPTTLRAALEALLAGRDLPIDSAQAVLAELIDEGTPRSLQGAFLVALRAKGETAQELAGLAQGLLDHARHVPRGGRPLCVDTAGTGGDGMQSFNLSSAAALLVAALGLPVAKHGNRSVSSRCGSADLLEALGLDFPSNPEEAGARLERDGFVFLFAPHFHPATAALASVRKELGVRTVFNLLGPLVNPARPSHQLIGAASPEIAADLAGASLELGNERTFVVHGQGFDEATPCGPFQLFDCRARRVEERRMEPEDFGVGRCRAEDLAGGDAQENAHRLRALFRGEERGPVRDAVCLNAALVLLLVGRENEPRSAQRAAEAALDDGRAERWLTGLRTDSRIS